MPGKVEKKPVKLVTLSSLEAALKKTKDRNSSEARKLRAQIRRLKDSTLSKASTANGKITKSAPKKKVAAKKAKPDNSDIDDDQEG